MATIVVAGYVAGMPNAGLFWHSMSYVLGFRALGHDAWFLEDSGDHPWSWDPFEHREDPALESGARLLAAETAPLGLADRWVLRHMPSGRHDGLDEDQTRELLASADIFVNVSLVTPMRPEYRQVPTRVGIDTDPVFTQIRIARGHGHYADVQESHSRLFTFGRPPLPAQRGEWVPTRQPVVTDLWPVAAPADTDAPFTSIAQWRSYPTETWEGIEYGNKDRSFPQFVDLPRRTRRRLKLAISGQGKREAVPLLQRHGWQLTDGSVVTRTTAEYRELIAGSVGEFGVAKHGYVAARSGWFSERTCCYLASGRPAIVQDTGWTDWLPSGKGVLAFTTPDQALEALETVADDPQSHAAAARAVVEEHFQAADVCADLLDHL